MRRLVVATIVASLALVAVPSGAQVPKLETPAGCVAVAPATPEVAHCRFIVPAGFMAGFVGAGTWRLTSQSPYGDSEILSTQGSPIGPQVFFPGTILDAYADPSGGVLVLFQSTPA